MSSDRGQGVLVAFAIHSLVGKRAWTGCFRGWFQNFLVKVAIRRATIDDQPEEHIYMISGVYS